MLCKDNNILLNLWLGSVLMLENITFGAQNNVNRKQEQQTDEMVQKKFPLGPKAG